MVNHNKLCFFSSSELPFYGRHLSMMLERSEDVSTLNLEPKAVPCALCSTASIARDSSSQLRLQKTVVILYITNES